MVSKGGCVCVCVCARACACVLLTWFGINKWVADCLDYLFISQSVLWQVQWLFHRVWSSAASFNFQCSLVSLTSSSSCLYLLLRLPITSVLPSMVPSIMCFRRQFLHKMWPIQLAFLHFVVCKDAYSCPPWLWIILPHFSHNRTFILSLILFRKLLY